MEITIKDSVFINTSEGEKVIRSGTRGVEHLRRVTFYDSTRTCSITLDMEQCIANKSLFQVTRNLTEPEIRIKDVVQILQEMPACDAINEAILRIKSL